MPDLSTLTDYELEVAAQDALLQKATQRFVAIQEEKLRRSGAPTVEQIHARAEEEARLEPRRRTSKAIAQAGLALYLPLLLATGMSFDAPGSEGNPLHLLMAGGNVLLGPLCLAALFDRFWYLGFLGPILTAASWLPLVFVCSGSFVCR